MAVFKRKKAVLGTHEIKIIFVAGLVLAIGALGNLFVIKSQKNTVVSLKKEIREVDNRLKLLGETNQYLEEEKKVNAGHFVAGTDSDTAIKQLAVIARKNNIEILSLTPKGEGQWNGAKQYSFEIQYLGSYRDTSRFIQTIEKDIDSSLIEEFSVSNITSNSTKQGKSRGVLRISTFMLESKS